MLENNLQVTEIDGGLLIEQINEELKIIVADIADINKKPTVTREITVKIKLSPSKSRREATLVYNVTSKPSTHIDRDPTTIYLGKNSSGEMIAKPWVPNQQVLPHVAEAFNNEETSN